MDPPLIISTVHAQSANNPPATSSGLPVVRVVEKRAIGQRKRRKRTDATKRAPTTGRINTYPMGGHHDGQHQREYLAHPPSMPRLRIRHAFQTVAHPLC